MLSIRDPAAMKNRQKALDVVHHGQVVISDGKGKTRQARLLLSKDQMSIQIAGEGAGVAEEPPTPEETVTRTVVINRKQGGLGLSIKGGTENMQNLPIVISKIFPGMPADETGQLSVGDAIVEVNGTSVEGKTHDDVVEMLKSATSEVRIGVRHYSNLTPFLKPALSLQSPVQGENAWKSKSEVALELDGDGKWSTITTLPLPMAYVTRYLFGTDNLRPNAFEVRSVDGTSSGIIHCEDVKAVEMWLGHVQCHVASLNHKSVRMSNKYLHTSEQISYIGWVDSRWCEESAPRQRWQPRFLVLKGPDLCLFESPPVPNDTRRLDKRENCCWIETGMNDGARHYISFENSSLLETFVTAYHKCLYNTINNMQSRTFACSFDSRPSGLVFDVKKGISLYDIPTKSYSWQYRFCDVVSSSDDGRMQLRISFHDERAMEANKIEVKDMECEEAVLASYTLHAFLVAKMVAADPEFLKSNPLV